MKPIAFLNRINRIIVSKSNSERRIKYLRKQGVKIGKRCLVDTLDFSTEPYLVELGDYVRVARGTFFLTHDAGVRCFLEEFPEDDIFGQIKIGNNVFIGGNSTILPNTVIGDNSIVGAGSVVRGEFPENSVIVGNPAKVIMPMKILKSLYKQNPGRMSTSKMTNEEKKPHILKHFNLMEENENELS